MTDHECVCFKDSVFPHWSTFPLSCSLNSSLFMKCWWKAVWLKLLREKKSSSPQRSAEESGGGRWSLCSRQLGQSLCHLLTPPEPGTWIGFLCSQGCSGRAPQWPEGNINLGSFIILSLWLNSFGGGVSSDGSDKLLVSGPGGFSLSLFLSHE